MESGCRRVRDILWGRWNYTKISISYGLIQVLSYDIRIFFYLWFLALPVMVLTSFLGSMWWVLAVLSSHPCRVKVNCALPNT